MGTSRRASYAAAGFTSTAVRLGDSTRSPGEGGQACRAWLRPTRAPIASVDDTPAWRAFLRGVSTRQPNVSAEAC